ncbi:hypothetical protein FS749_011543 [Ceratobasidium sp. UAMH 11750]|nr:hypothetical protein FS749_011543 [Ceratobasidium sp. UAMH 11750]
MNLRGILGLDSSEQKSVERDKFIGNSLTSSGWLSERMLAWSRPNDRGRLFPMKFHEVWQHEDCPVMGWYDQQCKSSTRFRSIEHRRNVDGPFFHEFLLLKLMDGAICRVERMGEGSRTDAIRLTGCTAHDLIQWFIESDYDKFSEKCPSMLIAKVDLCQDFDILDVLAICYSIQNTKACRAYTLQRYNCYFLCLTVIAMLTRRVASWETMVTSDDWNSCISSSLDQLSNLSLDDSKKHSIMRLCALLEPDNPQPARFILDALRVHLSSQTGALTSYKQAMNATLWRTAWDSSLHDGLVTSLQPAVPAILEDESHCGTLFRRAIHTSRKDAALAMLSDNVFANHFCSVHRKQFEREVDKGIETYKKRVRMREVEQPVSFGNRVLARLCSPFGGAVFALFPISLAVNINNSGSGGMVIFSRLAKTSRFKFGSVAASAWALDALDGTDTRGNILAEVAKSSQSNSMEAFLTTLLDRLAAKGLLGPSETTLVVTSTLNECRFFKLLTSLITSGHFSYTLRSMQESCQREICLLIASPDEPEPSKTSITPSDFQETYIRERLDAHAKRVSAHQLGAAPLVCEDIENTMTKVWKKLPPGFGGAVVPA